MDRRDIIKNNEIAKEFENVFTSIAHYVIVRLPAAV